MATGDASGPLLRNLRSFLDTSAFTDCTIQSETREFKVHRLILSAQSEYFKNMFDGEWKESNGAVTLKGDNILALEAMFEFMYTFNYDSSCKAEHSPSSMVYHVHVYSIADKYFVPGFKSLAKRNFQELIGSCWDMDTFPDAIAQVYHWSTASNSELREMILDVVCRHIKPLLQKQKFCDALEEIVGFAPDLVKGLAKERDDFEKYPCLGCGKMIVTRLSDHEERYYCVRCSLF